MNDYLCQYFYFVWKRMFKSYMINTLISRGASLAEAEEAAECEIEEYSKKDGYWKYIHPHDAAKEQLSYWSD
ncbi:hypothetical protein BDD30_1579 [Photorhabdus asymbiotica]|uniref:Uncharacterized protein n=2 Tax=Photorhabdus asymbiotica TaxID=291112 RepID=A0ABX9SN90_9GAMM|nr:hypothetical protein BDD30_1579 [Photorhabdus asymbiotica]